MALSTDLLSQFAKITKDEVKTKSDTTVYGTIVMHNGEKFVQIDGSDLLTPISSTTNVEDKERVTVMIKNHMATVTGNISSPAARTAEVAGVNEEVAKFSKVITEDLEATNARIDNLDADHVTVENLEAVNAEIENLKATKLTATDADLKYANIDFTNIRTAAMEYFYANSGLIKDVTVGDQTITGELVGVTISGDRIIGNTVIAEKLVIKGSDGLYYKLNTDGMNVETEQTDYNSLNGSVIKAKSITATKISVKDLVAFDATIGGFKIEDASIHSIAKTSVDNTTRGLYLGSDGQMALGDGNNYLKYYKTSDGSYKLAISLVDNLQIGGTNLIRKSQNLTTDSSLAAADRWRLDTGASTFTHDERFTGLKLYMTGATENTYVQAYSPVSLLPTGWLGRQVTLSAYIYSPDWSAVDASVRCSVRLSKGGTSVLNYGANTLVAAGGTLASGASTDGELTSGKWVRISTTFPLDAEEISSGTGVLADNTHVYVSFSLYRNGDVRIYAPKLEMGNKATDWSPAPDDTDAEFEDVRSEFSIEAGKIRSEVSNSVSGLQSQIDQTDGKIELAVENVRVGGTQLLRNAGFYNGLAHWSKTEYKVNGEYRELYVEPISPNNYRANEVPNMILHAQNETGMFGASQTVSLRKNTTYVISGYVASHRNNRACIEIRNTAATRWALQAQFDVGWGGTNLGQYNHFEYTFDTADYTDYSISLYSNNFGENAYVWWAQIKLEEGNKASAWSPHPEEFQAGTNVLITKDEFRVTTPEFNVNITSEDGTENMLHIDKDGGYMKAFESPTVAQRYDGPGTLYVNPNATSTQIAAGNYFRSLKDVANLLSEKRVSKTINVNVAAGHTEYGLVKFRGVTGSYWIQITGDSSSPATLSGGVECSFNTTPVLIRYVNINLDTSVMVQGVHAEGSSTTMTVRNCVITGPGTSVSGTRAIQSSRNACIYAYENELYDCERSLYGNIAGVIAAYTCKGNCTVGANRATLYLTGTMPCESTTWKVSTNAGQVLTGSVTVDQGSKPSTPVVTTTTVSYSMTNADNYTMGNGSWTNYSDEDIRQGYTTTNGMHRGCFWFNNTTIRSALSGKTIKQATLSLYQMSAGRSQPVQVNLEGITMNYSGRSGVPYGTQEYGVIGTTSGVGVTSTFTIPVQVITDLVAGTINGLMLRNDESSVLTGDDNSYHFARFAGGTTTAYRPVLTVTYT